MKLSDEKSLQIFVFSIEDQTEEEEKSLRSFNVQRCFLSFSFDRSIDKSYQMGLIIIISLKFKWKTLNLFLFR